MKKLFLRKRRVYVLPTKMGGYLNGLIFLMFLLSVGYSNNLLLIFTLFLFGFNLIWLVQTHYHLKALVPAQVMLEDGHVGEGLRLMIRWQQRPPGPRDCELQLQTEGFRLKASHLSQELDSTQGYISLPHRGLWRWHTLKIETDRPFGLYRAWIYWPLDLATFAWPQLQKIAANLPLQAGLLEGEVPTDKRGPGDMKGLLPYSNEEARQISWKHYARTGQLLVREGEEVRTPNAHFKWDEMNSGEAKEERLSQLATALVYCHRQDIPFSLQFAGRSRGPANSRSHLIQCLKDLSLC